MSPAEFGLLLPGEAAIALGVSTTTLVDLANRGDLSVVWTRGTRGHRRYYAREVELLGQLRAVERLARDQRAQVVELETVVARLEGIEDRLARVRAAIGSGS